MNYKAVTTLKRVDTEGQIPAYTLDQYVRNELCQQLIKAIEPRLFIDRSESDQSVHQPTVDFRTELILLKPDQWQRVKESLHHSLAVLPPDQQLAIQRLLNEVDTSC